MTQNVPKRSWTHYHPRYGGDNVFNQCVCVSVCPFVCLCLLSRCLSGNITMMDWCHTYNIYREYRWGCLVVQMMCHILVTQSMTSKFKSKSNHIIIVQCGHKYSHYVITFWCTQVSVLVWKNRQRSKIETGFGNFHNPGLHIITSIWLLKRKTDGKLCKMKSFKHQDITSDTIIWLWMLLYSCLWRWLWKQFPR